MLEEMLVTWLLGFLCLHAKVQLLISPFAQASGSSTSPGKRGYSK